MLVSECQAHRNLYFVTVSLLYRAPLNELSPKKVFLRYHYTLDTYLYFLETIKLNRYYATEVTRFTPSLSLIKQEC